MRINCHLHGAPPTSRTILAANKLKIFRFPFRAMGSPCEIQLFAEHSLLAKQIAKTAIADIQRLEAKYSRYRPDSLMATINQIASSGGSIEVDEETAGLLNYAQTCHQQSDGLFDISAGILSKAWQTYQDQLPSDAQIRALLQRVGWHRLDWSPPTLTFRHEGMQLDFGGIVKEYAADRAAELCQNAGARHGVVNLGGDVRIIGPRPDDRPWRIGIQHPRQSQAMLHTLSIHRGAVASSGDYQRYIMIDGMRYTHIIDPLSGWPVKHLASVSVISDFCVVAGSAATIAMLKAEQGPEWLQTLGLPHLWVDAKGRQGGSLLDG